jgi:hypothetical protein
MAGIGGGGRYVIHTGYVLLGDDAVPKIGI